MSDRIYVIIFKTRRKLEQCRDKKQLIKVALECMQAEIDRIKDEHDEYLKKVFEAHTNQISETKKKQWVSLYCRLFIFKCLLFFITFQDNFLYII